MNSSMSATALVFSTLAFLLSLVVARRTKQILESAEGRPAFVTPIGKSFPDIAPLLGSRGELAPLGGEMGNPVILGVFSAGCAGCAEELPVFKELMVRHHVPRERAVAILVGEGAVADAFELSLGEVCIVVRQELEGPVLEPLGIRSFPAFGVVAETGRIRSWGSGALALEKSMTEFARRPEDV
ncbi:TlpA family protein disulfide reductase [Streptomyces sp. NPDC090077]|uniref:TlpA family protein disulfide reductase n=1 Tax=Streptomyces sp. NPDC090077 TaxID=3365938 RepID=UPI00382D3565